MPQKTKKEKIIAEKRRREHILALQSSPKYSLEIKPGMESIRSQPRKETINTMTGHADLKKDLLKIGIFTLGAVTFQLILFFFVIK